MVFLAVTQLLALTAQLECYLVLTKSVEKLQIGVQKLGHQEMKKKIKLVKSSWEGNKEKSSAIWELSRVYSGKYISTFLKLIILNREFISLSIGIHNGCDPFVAY